MTVVRQNPDGEVDRPTQPVEPPADDPMVQRACAECGEPLAYVGPHDRTETAADEVGGQMECPNGHVEAVHPE
ncbi:MAG: hypothetical protein KAZ48_10880 [Candidatus Nanopelagicales bacterium]|nr:hypothetical protein [Candidatus Nanopelagicales bacterium]